MSRTSSALIGARVGRSTGSSACPPSMNPRVELKHEPQSIWRKARSSRQASSFTRAAGTRSSQTEQRCPSGSARRWSSGSIHEAVYPVGRSAALARNRLSAIPPGGMIERMTTPDTQPANAADHFRHSYTRDKSQLVRRLARIEGQVRGITRMIEREEYCVDILQQTSALRAAVDSLAVLVLEDHVTGCVRTAAANGEADRYVEEVVDVVRRTLGRPVRSATRS
jgi:DNA-binding FrmR family transcriptional regulator